MFNFLALGLLRLLALRQLLTLVLGKAFLPGDLRPMPRPYVLALLIPRCGRRDGLQDLVVVHVRGPGMTVMVGIAYVGRELSDF